MIPFFFMSNDDIMTLEIINEAWNEIQNNKGGRSTTSKFFAEFAKW